MNKILVVEPHGDDFICSCSSLLKNIDNRIDIITLGSSRSSDKLKDLYENINQVQYVELPELDYSLRPLRVSNDIHKRYLAGENVDYYYRSLLNKLFEDNDYVYNKVVDTLVNSEFLNYNYVFVPVGLVHPYHILVNKAAKAVKNAIGGNLVFYADKPYIGTRYARECLNSALRGYDIIAIKEVNYFDRPETVKNVLKEVYPTEVSMLRFSEDVLLNKPDIFASWFSMYGLFNNCDVKEYNCYE